MPAYRFYLPIEVRYGDLDPQGHVNNAKYLTYMEHARIVYIQQLGLWEGKSFSELGIILAEIRVTYLSPIHYNQKVRVGVRVSRLGEKSFDVDCVLEEAHTQKELARGSSVLVTYDYQTRQSVSIPEVWRHAISTFEGIPPISSKETP